MSDTQYITMPTDAHDADNQHGHSHNHHDNNDHSHNHHGHSHSGSDCDTRKRVQTPNGVAEPMGIIFPFRKLQTGMLSHIVNELRIMASQRQTKVIFTFILLNFVTLLVLTAWNVTASSMALMAYMYLVLFDLFALLTCLMSVWVEQQAPSPTFSFGYQRFEVLAVFSSTMVAALGSFFIVKECTERMLEQPTVHTGRLLPGALVVFVYHQLVTYTLTSSNRAFNHVISASSSSWLQEHVADMCEGLCHVVPGLSKILLPRINPFVLLGFAGGLALCITDLLIDIYAYYSADTVTAMLISFMVLGTMAPMAAYSGKILLQTTPGHVIGQLDKCIREASTLDGVLEFKNEHFWTLSFGKLAGSLHVRVRRDADEQLVLAHVTNRLSNLVHNLTIQVVKDDWSQKTTSVYQMLANSGYAGGYTGGYAGGYTTKPQNPREGSPISMYRPLTPVTANINTPGFNNTTTTEFANPSTADFRSSPLVPNIAPAPRGYTPRGYSPRGYSPRLGPNLQSYGSLAPGRTNYNPTALAYANSIAATLPRLPSSSEPKLK